MSRTDPGLYDFVTDEFLLSAPVEVLQDALGRLKAVTGPQLAADVKAKRGVRDGIDRIYRELDARAKGTTAAPPSPPPAAKPAAPAIPAAAAKAAAPAKGAAATADLDVDEEVEEEDDSETFGEEGDFD